jgi:N utilization substance protein A
LTNWHLDVNSETQYNDTMKKGYDSLVKISGVGASMADALFEKGFYSAEELAEAGIEDLIQVRGIAEGKAKQLVENAQIWLKEEAERIAEATAAQAAEEAATEQEPDDAEEATAAEKNPEDSEVTAAQDGSAETDSEMIETPEAPTQQ